MACGVETHDILRWKNVKHREVKAVGKRREKPGYRTVTSGGIRLGDLVWDDEVDEWRTPDDASVGDDVNHYYHVVRPISVRKVRREKL